MSYCYISLLLVQQIAIQRCYRHIDALGWSPSLFCTEFLNVCPFNPWINITVNLSSEYIGKGRQSLEFKNLVLMLLCCVKKKNSGSWEVRIKFWNTQANHWTVQKKKKIWWYYLYFCGVFYFFIKSLISCKTREWWLMHLCIVRGQLFHTISHQSSVSKRIFSSSCLNVFPISDCSWFCAEQFR